MGTLVCPPARKHSFIENQNLIFHGHSVGENLVQGIIIFFSMDLFPLERHGRISEALDASIPCVVASVANAGAA